MLSRSSRLSPTRRRTNHHVCASGDGLADNLTEDLLLQQHPVPATPFADRFRTVAVRRTVGIGLALLLEALLLLVLFSLGAGRQPGRQEQPITVVNLEAPTVLQEVPEAESRDRVEPAEERSVPQGPAPEEPRPQQSAEPLPVQPAEALPQQPAQPQTPPAAPAIMPTPQEQRSAAAIPSNPVQPTPSGKSLYGPPNKGGSSSGDTERVGTAPNGEPLYAAAWYREPRADEMRGYLSTASGPGWGLIACRTASNYRVEDCVALDEYPEGSRINRAALAAAWVFQVQPPRLGGRSLVGSWVRIRIDYGIKRR